ncbi:unnamed protein product, partial [Rotaria magnacalcarata]
HDEPPNDEQIDLFIQTCTDFINSNPNDFIGVHCTHGFNRTDEKKISFSSIQTAIDLFAAARSPGIYKQDYLNKLIEKFATDDATSIHAPLRP